MAYKMDITLEIDFCGDGGLVDVCVSYAYIKGAPDTWTDPGHGPEVDIHNYHVQDFKGNYWQVPRSLIPGDVETAIEQYIAENHQGDY